MAVLMDCDGDVVFAVPETWEDCQLFEALKHVNMAFRFGKEMGRSEKTMELKRVLEINE